VLASAPEAVFINRCLREPDARRPSELAVIGYSIRRWDVLVEAAQRHGTAAFVLASVDSERVPLPPAVAETLEQRAYSELACVMLLDEELRRIGSTFAAERLPLIVLKGPVLARTVYPAASLRPYGDLDLLVQVDHESSAATLLLAMGFAEAPYAAEVARRARPSASGTGAFHRVFSSRSNGARVELHVDPFQLGIPPVCEEDRWRRAVPVPGIPGVCSLDPSDQFVHLCVHAHKHGFNRLIWLKDLDLFIRRYRDCIDWQMVCEVARREGVLASVWYSLELVRTLFSTPIESDLFVHFRPSPLIAALYRAIWTVDCIAGLNGHMRRRAVQFHAAESWRGMLPSIVLMGRRRERVEALLHALFRS
jgi:hypothetical protein